MSAPENVFEHSVFQDSIQRLNKDGYTVHYVLFGSEIAPNGVAVIPADEYQEVLDISNAYAEESQEVWTLGMLEADSRFIKNASAWTALALASEAAAAREDIVTLAIANTLPAMLLKIPDEDQ